LARSSRKGGNSLTLLSDRTAHSFLQSYMKGDGRLGALGLARISARQSNRPLRRGEPWRLRQALT
jgi:hypothetical protein